jgi:hypothetical protein
MLKWVSVVLLMVFVLPLGAQQPEPLVESPASFLPADTALYIEGQNLTETFDLLGKIVLPGVTLPIPEIQQPRQGDGVTFAVFSTVDELAFEWTAFLPTGVLIVEVFDEAGADRFVADFTGGWESQSDGKVRIWKNPFPLITPAALRIPGYLVIGEERGIEHLARLLSASSDSLTLTTNPTFNRFQKAVVPDPSLWVYTPDSTWAVAIEDAQITFDFARMGDTSETVPAMLQTDALEAVPIGSLVVGAGMNANLILQNWLDSLDDFAATLSLFDPNLGSLPLQIEALWRTAFGIDLREDFVPLFDGGYAFFLSRVPAVSGGIALDAGLILTPQDSTNVPFTLTRLSNRLVQNFGLSIELSGQLQYTLTDDTLPDFIYGLADGHVYLSTQTGAEAILRSLDGVNIDQDARWRRALEVAPSSVQSILYINLREGIDLAEISLLQAGIDDPLISELFATLKQYESMAFFQRRDLDGLRLTRFALLLNR